MLKLASLLASAFVALWVSGAHASGVTDWSQPATLSACPGDGAPRAVFPSDRPNHSTGAGAVIWSATPQCSRGAGMLLAPIGAGDAPGRAAYPRDVRGRTIELPAVLAASGAPDGQMVVAGSSSGAGGANGLLVEGRAGGPFAAYPESVVPASSLTLATAYLGDIAAASAVWSPDDRGVLQLRVERHFVSTFAPPLTLSTGATGPVQELTIALDYRSDALAVWREGAAIYARDLPASGQQHATERLAPARSDLHITALLSDDNRAIVAWSEESDGETSVYLETSAPGVRFDAPTLLERFPDPDGLPSPSGSPHLVRLSSESVMLAWAGAQGGHWVVRTAAVDVSGVHAVNTVSPPGSDALLADLAPGPDGEAIAMWTEPQQSPQGLLDLDRQAIYAARGFNVYPGVTFFGSPEQVAPPAENSNVSVTFDPDSDRALALWQGEGGAIEYAIRDPSKP